MEFWQQVAIGPGCWLWLRGHDGHGYGTFSWKGRPDKAHRVAYMFAHGLEDPPEGHVCHRCDTPPCCRPDHLFEGTHTDNMYDALEKGRLHPRFYRQER